MAGELSGKTIAILATDGVEEVELTEPRRALEEAGAEVHLLAPKSGSIQAMDHLDRSSMLKVDRVIGQSGPSDYDGIVLPGGVVNADHLRADKDAVSFVRAFLEADMPIAVICHGPWVLVETGLLEGRTLTSYHTLQTDIRNAGARWVDEQVQEDGNLISSRRPADLEVFCPAIVELFARGGRRQSLRRAA